MRNAYQLELVTKKLAKWTVLGALSLAAMHSAQAACLTAEVESNNTDTTANVGLCSGSNVTGSMASSDDDWFALNVTAPGTITVNLSHATGVDIDWYLYRSTGSYVASKATSANPEVGSYTASAAGTYYVKLKRYSGSGTYTLNVSLPTASTACTLPRGVDLGRVGSASDKTTTTSGGFVLMGGGTDVDAAMQWMINKAGGGDVVVIRSTGTNGYNSYLQGLGTVNSVQTLLIDTTTEGSDACVAQTIKNAEMLFITGGNQQDYVNYFKGRATGDAINYLINTKKVPVGGTSAGMAILGQYYHPGGAPDNSTVLANPTTVAIGNNFVNAPILANVVTDTHFSQRSRFPRLVAFLASSVYNFSVPWQNVRGIAADEASAFAVEPTGAGKVFGTGNVFFAKPTGAAETLLAGQALTWYLGGQALQIYKVPGTATGNNTFNLSTWSGVGGTSHYWAVSNGSMTMN